jgi:hypothetical protein
VASEASEIWPGAVPQVVFRGLVASFRQAAEAALSVPGEDWGLSSVVTHWHPHDWEYRVSLFFGRGRSSHFRVLERDLREEGSTGFFDPRFSSWFESTCRHLWDERFRPNSIAGMRRRMIEMIDGAERFVQDHGYLRQMRRDVDEATRRAEDDLRRPMRVPVPSFVGVDFGSGDYSAPQVFRHRELTATEARRQVDRRLQEYTRYVEQMTRRIVASADPSIIRGAHADVFWIDECGAQDPAAAERAEQLLRDNLSKKQLKEYDEHGHFEVRGGDTGRRYMITKGLAFNVYYEDRIKLGFVQWKPMCFVPKDALAMGDVLLSQKITLELDERTALRVANYR